MTLSPRGIDDRSRYLSCGQVIKNAVAHAVMVVVTEAGALSTSARVDCRKLIEMLSDVQMGIQRPLTYRYGERIVNGDYEGGMPHDAAHKDSVLALQLARALGVPLFAILGSHAVYEVAAAAVMGGRIVPRLPGSGRIGDVPPSRRRMNGRLDFH